MRRPDLATLACVNAECQMFRQPAQGNLLIQKVYGHDRMRLLRCRRCGEECSERCGTGSEQMFGWADHRATSALLAGGACLRRER